MFVRLHTHPVMLFLLESIFGAAVRASGTAIGEFGPAIKLAMPQDGSLGPGQEWHSDTPYDKGLRGLPSGRKKANLQPTDAGEDLYEWPEASRPLGVQCNVCIDPFVEANGATCFIPGSCFFRGPPPQEMNANPNSLPTLTMLPIWRPLPALSSCTTRLLGTGST